MALPTASTPIAKSLHTLTVLQQVARLISTLPVADRPAPPIPEALDDAMRVLGLAGRPDPYDLHARALSLLTAR